MLTAQDIHSLPVEVWKYINAFYITRPKFTFDNNELKVDIMGNELSIDIDIPFSLDPTDTDFHDKYYPEYRTQVLKFINGQRERIWFDGLDGYPINMDIVDDYILISSDEVMRLKVNILAFDSLKRALLKYIEWLGY